MILATSKCEPYIFVNIVTNEEGKIRHPGKQNQCIYFKFKAEKEGTVYSQERSTNYNTRPVLHLPVRGG